MKRWLLILLIALLPIQFSWAAVGVYCGDEHESSLEHAAHAKKPAQNDAAAHGDGDSGSGSTLGSGFDFECGNHCHGHSTSLPAASYSLTTDSAGAQWTDDFVALRTRLIQFRPERPQWQALA